MNSTSIKIITDSSIQTQKVAELLVKTLSDKKYSPPHIFALQGNLGAGKTTFIQGVAKALKIKQKHVQISTSTHYCTHQHVTNTFIFTQR